MRRITTVCIVFLAYCNRLFFGVLAILCSLDLLRHCGSILDGGILLVEQAELDIFIYSGWWYLFYSGHIAAVNNPDGDGPPAVCVCVCVCGVLC